MPDENKIIFQIEGPVQNSKHLDLSVFVKKVGELKSFLDASLKENAKKGVTFQLVNVSHSSPVTVECALRGDYAPTADADENHAIESITQSLDSVVNGMADNLSNPVLSALKKLAGFDADKISRVEIRTLKGASKDPLTFRLDERFRERLSKVQTATVRCVSTVDGKLEQINIHKGNIFTIYRSLPLAPPVACKFSPDFLEKVHDALGKYVSVWGECFYRPNANFPHAINVQKMEVLPDSKDLPTLSDLYGIAPDMTDGLSSEEFVRRQRDEWD